MKKKEALDILGLKEGYTEDELKKNYRSLCSMYHPDKEGGSDEKMAEINAARDALINNNFDQENSHRSWEEATRRYTQGNWRQFTDEEFARRYYRGETLRHYLAISIEDLMNGKTYTIGDVRTGENIVVNIIPGETFDQSVIKFPGKGGKPGHPSAEPGDLYVIVYVKSENGISVIDKYDTESTVEVDVLTAIYGGQVEVLTPHGKFKITVMPNKDNFRSEYRLKGKGLPMTRSKQVFGNHFVKLIINLPNPEDMDKLIESYQKSKE